jgi:hypothetical protein
MSFPSRRTNTAEQTIVTVSITFAGFVLLLFAFNKADVTAAFDVGNFDLREIDGPIASLQKHTFFVSFFIRETALRRTGVPIRFDYAAKDEVNGEEWGNRLRIAQVAPLVESVPPKHYGGTERIVAYLTEELVHLGHKVTLFASGDSVTSAELVPVCRRSFRQNKRATDYLSRGVLLMDHVMRRAGEFDVIHFHTGCLHYLISRPTLCRPQDFLAGNRWSESAGTRYSKN